MARFRIGQRVQVIYSISEGASCVGKEATVTGECGTNLYSIDVDSVPPPRGTWLAYGDQLEPLTDSNELVSWESMRDLWVPEHLRVKA